jgi:hypothetical protein
MRSFHSGLDASEWWNGDQKSRKKRQVEKVSLCVSTEKEVQD